MPAMNTLDNVYALKILRILTLPWEKQKAYLSGVIDKTGRIIVAPENRTQKQRDSIDRLDVLVFNLKKLIEKVPFGKTTIARYAVALRLLKEGIEDKNDLVLSVFYKYIKENGDLDGEDQAILEDVAMSMNTTSGIDMGTVARSLPLFSRKRNLIRNKRRIK